MRIDSITLKNIKAHADFSAEFLPGINFIGGRNGAGKTTIIESIGLALFGYPIKDFKEYFLKYGEKQGEITVRFTVGSDTYSVVRKIGTADTRRIFQNGAELDIEHRTDFNAFMRELLGLSPSEDLAQLFATIIGVPQGCLTQSFLQRPSDRKYEFNSVLKVDSYRMAADKGRDIKNYITDNKSALQVDIARYQGELMRLEPLREAIIQKAAELDALKIKVSDLEVQKQQAQCAAEGFKAQKVASDKAKADMSSAEAAKRTIEAEYKAIVLRYQDALEAIRVLETFKEGYDAHIAAEKEKKGLELKRSAREALVRKYHALMQKAGFILEATDEEKTSLTEMLSQNESKLIALQTQTGELYADMTFETYPNAQRAVGGVLGRLCDTLDQLGTALEEKRGRIQRNTDDLKAGDKKIAVLKAHAAADIALLHQAEERCCPVTELPCDKLNFDEAALAG
jgi:exonuclease SbcC